MVYCVNIGFVELYELAQYYNFTPILILACLILSLLSFLYYKKTAVLYFLVVVMFFFLSALFGLNFEYGLKKVVVGILFPISLMMLMVPLKNKKDIIYTSFCHLVILINVFALIYKIQNGFWIRDINFGLFGPITFGWLNTLMLVISMLKTRNWRYFLIAFLMIIWCGSKGPFVISSIFIFFAIKKHFKQISFKQISLFLIVICIAYNYIDLYENSRIFKSLTQLFLNTDSYTEGEGAGSIGSRISFYLEGINLWRENWLVGVGFGSWENYVPGHKYPHNFFLELLAETGLIGFLLMSSLLLWLKQNEYYIIFLTGVCLQLTSGDVSYFRYYFIFILIGLLNNNSSNISKKQLG